MSENDKWAEARRKALADIATTSDEEDARITAAALADPDAQPWTDEMWARATTFEERQRRRAQRALPAQRRLGVSAWLHALHADSGEEPQTQGLTVS